MKTSRIGLGALAAISWAMASASVTGVVVDEHGKPIPGADVWLMTEAVHNQGPLTIGVTSTDAAGKFLFRYDVPFGALVTCSAVAPGRAIDWHLAAGPKAYAHLVLKPATPREGSVVDENDKPIPGATVWPTDLYATPPSPGKARGCGFPQQIRARLAVTTDASGHFVLPWLTEGSQILIEADAPGYARVRPYDFWRTPPGPLKIVLPRPATVEGTVTCEAAPAAVQGLTIHATVTDVDQGWYAMAKAVTDAHGRFRLEGLPPGQLSVDCSPPDTQPWRPKLIGTSRLRGLSLGQTAVLTFPLVKGILVHGRTVEQASGQPIPGVRVNLSGMSVSANATSDAAGNYSLYALPTTGPAFVRAEAWPVEYLPVREQPKPSTDPRGSQPPDSVSLTPGTVAPVEGPTLQFSRAMTLPGRVLDETGRPAPGAVVLGTHGHDTIAGEDGSFTLASLAIGSTVFVWAESDGLWPASAVAVTTSAHPAPVTLKLSSKNWCRLRCLVLDENGAPVEGATVSGWGRFPGSAQPSTGPNVQGETGADGRFVSPPVPAIAEYSLMAFLQNKPGTAGTQTSAVWQAVAGEDHDFGTLSFPKPRTGFRGGPRPAPPADGTVSGRVVDNAGNPVASARVFNRGDSPPPAPASGILRTAADGRFTLAHLYRGPVWVFVEDARVLGAQGYGFTGKLAKTGDAAVEITLPPPPGPSTVGKPSAFEYPAADKEPAIVRTAIDDLWQWAKDHKQEQRVTGTYWQALAMLDPQLAATFPNGDDGTLRALARAHEMLAKDPDGAIALIRSLPNEPAQCAVFVEAA